MMQNHDGRKIVVGVDGSPGSRSALRWALAEAETRATEIVAAYAWHAPTFAYDSPGYVPPDTGEIHDIAQAALDQVIDGLPHRDDVKIELRARPGRPVDVLYGAADDPGVGLAVVGTRGHGRIAGLVLGSVSHGLTHRCPKPLVIVPDPGPEREAGPPRGRIVVGVDGSHESHVALLWAADEAERRNATLEVVVVAAPPPLYTSKVGLMENLKADSETVLKDAVHRIGITRLPIEAKVLEGRSVAHALTAEAATGDLLVVGSRGLGRATEAVLGSVSHACAHSSPVPVVVVPATTAPKAA